MHTKIRAKKSLSQNFLIDNAVKRRVVDAALIGQGDNVLEIGPGTGALTGLLAEKALSVTAVEKDRFLVSKLKEDLRAFSNIHIKEGDILDFDLAGELKAGRKRKIKVVGSLPYSITTPILFYLVQRRVNIELAVLIVQKEVARRIVAGPGSRTYGALSVGIQFFCDAEIIRDIQPGAFRPQPKVSSSIIRLRFHEKGKVRLVKGEDFVHFTKMIFSKRRKTVLNSLWWHMKDRLKKDEIKDILVNMDIDPGKRCEELSLIILAEIFNDICRAKRRQT